MSTINFNALKSFDGNISDTEFNRLVDIIQSIEIAQGAGYLVNRSAVGTLLDFSGGSGSGTAYPFKIKLRLDAGTLKLTVTPGTVNNLVPSNMFEEFTISDTGDYYVKVQAYSDGETLTSCSLVVDTNEPEAQTATPFSLPVSVDLLIGIVHNGKPFRTMGPGSFSLQGHEEFRLDKEPAADPGQLVYTPYYAWREPGYTS